MMMQTATTMNALNTLEPLVVIEQEMPLRDVERSIILATLRNQRYNRTRTAKVLGIGIRTLQRRLKQYREETGMDIAAG